MSLRKTSGRSGNEYSIVFDAQGLPLDDILGGLRVDIGEGLGRPLT